MEVNLKILLYISITLSILFGSFGNDRVLPSGKDYYKDNNGEIYIYVNIIGHVKSPGSYLVFEGADILTTLAQAGGPLKGAKISNVRIVPQNGSSYIVDLKKIIEGTGEEIVIKPNDTIYIDETLGSYILSRGNVVNVLIQITNLLLIASGNR